MTRLRTYLATRRQHRREDELILADARAAAVHEGVTA